MGPSSPAQSSTENAGPRAPAGIRKVPTGIFGLDEITGGGLPRGRATLVSGGPGTGKTLMGVDFLVQGIREHDEPGVLVALEESREDLIDNAASLGFDLQGLMDEGRLVIDAIEIDSGTLSEAGAFDLEGLFIRLGHAIDTVGAKRVVLDALENLFTATEDQATIRAEIHRLFRWLKSRGVTAVVTAERGENTLTRHGIEEYVSDCVIALDQNIVEQVATRRLHIVKYRGSGHGTNVYPFILDGSGFSVIPITGASLERGASTQRISLGVPELDHMIGGQGPYRGNTILLAGTAGSGKTTLASHAADAACARGERCIYYSFEQSVDAIIRDTGILGIRLQEWVDQGLLRFQGSRPGSRGLDHHLASMRRQILDFRPHVVILDPITGFSPIGATWEMKNMLLLLLDVMSEADATLVMTSLVHGGAPLDTTQVGVTSLADVWILLRDLEEGKGRTRGLQVLKSRGLANAKDTREFNINEDGLRILGPAGSSPGGKPRGA